MADRYLQDIVLSRRRFRIAFDPIRPMLGRRPDRGLDPGQRRRAIVALSWANFRLALLRFRKVTVAAMQRPSRGD